jgi:nitroreductase
MALPVESWYQSILLRHSERSYSDEPVSEKDLSRLEKTCREFRPYKGARAELVRSPPDDVFKGAVGSYGKVRGAPHYVAYVGDNDSPTADIALGYMGEGIILDATSLGLNTCWVAGFFRPEVVRKHIDVADSEYVAGVTPIGYAEDKAVRIDSLRSGHIKMHKRQQLHNLILHESLAPKQWMTKALEAARLAPSAVNRQPWRFLIEDDSITITETSSGFLFGRIPYRLDCGIAMLHLELGALATGTRGKWTILETPQVAKFQIV